MNGKHRKTLVAVFKEPVSGSIAWSDIEGLLIAGGCSIVEGSGFGFRTATKLKAFIVRIRPKKQSAIKCAPRAIS